MTCRKYTKHKKILYPRFRDFILQQEQTAVEYVARFATNPRLCVSHRNRGICGEFFDYIEGGFLCVVVVVVVVG